jgi:energy-coupling factor transport system permease protein
MSLNFAKIFNFLHSDTLLHRIDPRAKGFMILSFSILSFVFRDIVLMILLLGCSIPFLLIAKMGKNFVDAIKGMNFLIIFILIINSYTVSVNFSVLIIVRIIVLMLIFSIYFQSTLPEDLSQSLVTMKIPFHTAFAFSLAFRFVPTMANETQTIMDAQQSRGHRIQEGGMFQQVKNLIPLLVPLLMNSIRRAFHVAEALETRAFGVSKNPTFYYPLKFTPKDFWFLLLNVIILGIGLYIHINLANLPAWLSWSLTF